MTRKILCLTCMRGRYTLTDADRFNGYKERAIQFELRTPAIHKRESDGHTVPLYEVCCDRCNEVIHNGSPVLAVTWWKAEKYKSEPEPDPWEWEFGAPINEN